MSHMQDCFEGSRQAWSWPPQLQTRNGFQFQTRRLEWFWGVSPNVDRSQCQLIHSGVRVREKKRYSRLAVFNLSQIW
jgi:hypothetical protein